MSSLTPKIIFLSIPEKTPEKQNTRKTSRKIEIELFRCALFHTKTRVCLKYFVHDCRLQLTYKHLNPRGVFF